MIHIGIIKTRTSTSASFRLGKTGEGVEKVGVDKLGQYHGRKKEKRRQQARKSKEGRGDFSTRFGKNQKKSDKGKNSKTGEKAKGGNDQGHSQSQGGTRRRSESSSEGHVGRSEGEKKKSSESKRKEECRVKGTDKKGGNDQVHSQCAKEDKGRSKCNC